jgi:hypothetical protein
VLIYENSTDALENCAIVSLGPRHGLNLGRILALKSSSAVSLKQLMAQIVRLLKKHGGHILQFVSADEKINDELAEIGWSCMPDTPVTYIYHKDKKQIFEHCSFGGAAGDFGFEAIP